MTDPQVLAASRIKPRESLLDKLLEQYDVEEKEPAFPFQVRLILCGKLGKKDFSGAALETVCTEACMKADLTNPFTASAEKSMSCSSIFIDYGDHFVQIIEGDERHIFFYVTELWQLQEKGTLTQVKILFVEDDLEHLKTYGWIVLTKLPPAALGGGPQVNPETGVAGEPVERSDDEIADCVARDIEHLVEMSKHAGVLKKSNFIDNAKVDYPTLFPKSELVQLYMKTHHLFMTLSEFKECFCRFPDLVREVEVNHPSEDPLKY